MGYDDVKLLAEAMKNHGTDSEQIKEGLLQTKDFEGVIGVSSFDERGVADRKQFINTIKDGRFQATS